MNCYISWSESGIYRCPLVIHPDNYKSKSYYLI